MGCGNASCDCHSRTALLPLTCMQTSVLLRYKRFFNLEVDANKRAELVEAVTKHFIAMVSF